MENSDHFIAHVFLARVFRSLYFLNIFGANAAETAVKLILKNIATKKQILSQTSNTPWCGPTVVHSILVACVWHLASSNLGPAFTCFVIVCNSISIQC